MTDVTSAIIQLVKALEEKPDCVVTNAVLSDALQRVLRALDEPNRQ